MGTLLIAWAKAPSGVKATAKGFIPTGIIGSTSVLIDVSMTGDVMGPPFDHIGEGAIRCDSDGKGRGSSGYSRQHFGVGRCINDRDVARFGVSGRVWRYIDHIGEGAIRRKSHREGIKSYRYSGQYFGVGRCIDDRDVMGSIVGHIGKRLCVDIRETKRDS